MTSRRGVDQVVEYLVQLTHNFNQIGSKILKFCGVFGVIGTNSG